MAIQELAVCDQCGKAEAAAPSRHAPARNSPRYPEGWRRLTTHEPVSERNYKHVWVCSRQCAIEWVKGVYDG